MICVSLGRSRHARMIGEHQQLVEQGAELVELRVDYIGRAVNLGRLMDNRPGPVVITARRRIDGGRWTKSEQERLMLLRSAIVAGAEYVDIETDIASQIPRYGTTKRIISYHDFERTPENLEDLHAAMAEEDADIVKIATMANTFRDNVRMLKLVREAKVPTIGICMGEIGMLTRILANRFGSPFTYATYSVDKKMAPGQLNWKDMTRLYDVKGIDQDTELFGVIADPVSHSYSPMIHNSAFADQQLNARYLPLRVPHDDLHHFMDSVEEIGLKGISITIPHKERALDYCTQAEASANGIGAINTMVFHNGEKLGYNTDYRAAMDCIVEILERGDAPKENSLQGVTAMVLGAGGVSRAIAWGLKQRQADVIVTSRNEERTQHLASEIGCRAVPWEDRHNQKVQLLINGTPVGMHPNVDTSPFNASALNQFMVVFDTVYNPENTLLIKYAQQAQCRIITGIDMFVRQAAYQYKLFTGKDAPARLMRKTIKQATNPVQIH
ncbi:shikimate dehydrogenase [Rhodopirellula sp. MGV]|uniref:shikimate dehydrogenase n=1 Tax=Rhodopirellula sp. MGV TaxID=2023130 RepID=UPI000B97C3A6|nr:shikimate dehydrogenase [Rhodopirellula sp. MGV]OYP36951.1 3-dehydroquinate dehydratase [Rhodopirellula sp. MGV]PNY36287.1 shikimate dehydrogenase [Rhodopirellula baltica]